MAYAYPHPGMFSHAREITVDLKAAHFAGPGDRRTP